MNADDVSILIFLLVLGMSFDFPAKGITSNGMTTVIPSAIKGRFLFTNSDVIFAITGPCGWQTLIRPGQIHLVTDEFPLRFSNAIFSKCRNSDFL